MKKQRISPLLFTVYSAAASGRSPALPCFAVFLALVRFSGLFAFTQFFFQTPLTCADRAMHFFEPLLCTFYLTNTDAAFLWYNVIVKKQTPQEYYTAYQLKLPVEIEKIIEISDPVYSFSEVMDHIDLNKYLTIEERRPGRPRYDQKTLLKIILFAFMENGYASVREIEKYCKTDIRYMWLLQDNPPPSHMTIDNFMNKTMLENIDRIFADVNEYIFQKEQVDLNHVYIDGTKISANAGKYSWVWKKSCEKNCIKLFAKITELLENMNAGTALLGVKFDIREEYAIEYLEEIY